MTTPLRPELGTLPVRLRALPLDARGYPIPWFVAWINGAPEFRALDPDKWSRAVRDRLCWVCGLRLGRHLAFVIGPMCALNRVTSEPPCHLECAEWSAQHCPFLARPHARRREDAMTEELEKNVAGEAIKRNPGVACVWVTDSYKVFNDGAGKPLIQIGEPGSVRWYAEGREATRAEVDMSIATGLPALFDACDREDTLAKRQAAYAALAVAKQKATQWLPSATI